ncbi:MAG TPA: DUF1874 domain-containing protein [Pyrinomonadaceae bacterium]|nr:DUF1874 domain-containing protein [Pyrinomonadaceae bacterium]
MKRLVLLNAPVLTVYGKFEFKPLSINEARQIIREAETVESAVGHAATAEIMAELLDYKIEANRIEFYQKIDEAVLIFKLKKRVGEGKVLNREEIEKIGYEFGLLTRLE